MKVYLNFIATFGHTAIKNIIAENEYVEWMNVDYNQHRSWIKWEDGSGSLIKSKTFI